MDPFEPFSRENERPLEHLAADGGYSRIFRRIACIGDSLSSGEFETVREDGTKQYHDVFEQSWGQYLARMLGATAYNFSAGGMTAEKYCRSFADLHDYWNPKYASQAYIIALGANDLSLKNNFPLGSAEDLDLRDWRNNRPTFAGYYGQIMQRYRQIVPESKLFLMTMPRADGSEEYEARKQAHAELLYRLADRFPNTYVLDFHRYAPVYDSRFRELFFLHGHMNPCGYLLTAQLVASYLDFIIRRNMNDFRGIGLIPAGQEDREP